jgi:hypothetical protein
LIFATGTADVGPESGFANGFRLNPSDYPGMELGGCEHPDYVGAKHSGE